MGSFREANYAGIKLTWKRPFKIINNELIPNKQEKKIFSKPVEQLFNYGYWIQRIFTKYVLSWILAKLTENILILIKQLWKKVNEIRKF